MVAQETLPNQEIIDATQDAVLNAVGNVAIAIETTAQEIGGHELVPFYQSAEFWVAVSFMLVVVGLAWPIFKIARKKLKSRGHLIGKRIEDASNVYLEAQKMLAEYEKKYRAAKQEAGAILAGAEREVALLKKEKMAKLEQEMINREKEAEARIVAARDEAIKEISVVTTNQTMKIVRETIESKLSDAKQSKLIDKTIEWLQKNKI